jgi:beta-N-acetylhexosaminidase
MTRRARAALGAAVLLAGLASCGAGDGVSVPTAGRSGGAEGRTAATTPGAAADPIAALQPPIRQWRIPFPARRKREMAAYAYRHYGIRDWRLRDPQLIVIHYSQTASAAATRNTFLPDVPDPELHERPGTCAHFVVDRFGRIYQLVDLGTMCRHAFGVNWTAIGIEHVGYSDAQVLSDGRQFAASLRLVRWLRCRFGIQLRNVIGHAETPRSRFWRERDPRRSRETHGDFARPAMTRYRARLARLACPS